MSQSSWDAVDRYFAEHLLAPDPALDAAIAASRAAGLPEIAVAPNQGKLLNMMARACGARRILEIGTLGGYSAIWLARALPDGGKLITLEFDPKHAQVARSNLARAGLADRAEVITGPALETLPRLSGPFDFVFIDANKDGYPDYFRWAVKLARKGTMIVADNVVRGGKVADAKSRDGNVIGVRRMIEAIAAEPRVEATVLQTVGFKGYDGWAVALVVAD